MPQMAPMNWLSLFIMFSIIFLMFNVMNYYSVIPTSTKSLKFKSTKTKFNWKW